MFKKQISGHSVFRNLVQAQGHAPSSSGSDAGSSKRKEPSASATAQVVSSTTSTNQLLALPPNRQPIPRRTFLPAPTEQERSKKYQEVSVIVPKSSSDLHPLNFDNDDDDFEEPQSSKGASARTVGIGFDSFNDAIERHAMQMSLLSQDKVQASTVFQSARNRDEKRQLRSHYFSSILQPPSPAQSPVAVFGRQSPGSVSSEDNTRFDRAQSASPCAFDLAKANHHDDEDELNRAIVESLKEASVKQTSNQQTQSGSNGDLLIDVDQSDNADVSDDEKYFERRTITFTFDVDAIKELGEKCFSAHDCQLKSKPFKFAGLTWQLVLFPFGTANLFVDPKFAKIAMFFKVLDPEKIDLDIPTAFVMKIKLANTTVFVEKELSYSRWIEDAGHKDFGPLRNVYHLKQLVIHAELEHTSAYLLRDVLSDSSASKRPRLGGATSPLLLASVNPRAECGMVGLVNQGATCYLNALLQSLFHVPSFRAAIYQTPIPAFEARADSKTFQLQKLFYNLQTSETAVHTEGLTTSFGWGRADAFQQQDVQEFARVFLEKLEEVMRGSSVENAVKEHFVGVLQSMVKCLNVDYESKRREEFSDVTLAVKGIADLHSSFRQYIAEERLVGDNQYRTDRFGKQDAVKGSRFARFPRVLQLQLRRFDYDPILDQMVKVNDRFSFPAELDLSEMIVPEQSANPASFEYVLQSVLVHSGGAHGGHYWAFVRPDPINQPDQWFKLDDSSVYRCSSRDAIDANFGASGAFATHSAYMLSYVQKSEVSLLMRPNIPIEIPDALAAAIQDDERLAAEAEEKRLAKERMTSLHIVLDVPIRRALDKERLALSQSISPTMSSSSSSSTSSSIKQLSASNLPEMETEWLGFDRTRMHTLQIEKNLTMIELSETIEKEFGVPKKEQVIFAIWQLLSLHFRSKYVEESDMNMSFGGSRLPTQSTFFQSAPDRSWQSFFNEKHKDSLNVVRDLSRNQPMRFLVMRAPHAMQIENIRPMSIAVPVKYFDVINQVSSWIDTYIISQDTNFNSIRSMVCDSINSYCAEHPEADFSEYEVSGFQIICDNVQKPLPAIESETVWAQQKSLIRSLTASAIFSGIVAFDKSSKSMQAVKKQFDAFESGGVHIFNRQPYEFRIFTIWSFLIRVSFHVQHIKIALLFHRRLPCSELIDGAAVSVMSVFAPDAATFNQLFRSSRILQLETRPGFAKSNDSSVTHSNNNDGISRALDSDGGSHGNYFHIPYYIGQTVAQLIRALSVKFQAPADHIRIFQSFSRTFWIDKYYLHDCNRKIDDLLLDNAVRVVFEILPVSTSILSTHMQCELFWSNPKTFERELVISWCSKSSTVADICKQVVTDLIETGSLPASGINLPLRAWDLNLDILVSPQASASRLLQWERNYSAPASEKPVLIEFIPADEQMLPSGSDHAWCEVDGKQHPFPVILHPNETVKEFRSRICKRLGIADALISKYKVSSSVLRNSVSKDDMLVVDLFSHFGGKRTLCLISPASMASNEKGVKIKSG